MEEQKGDFTLPIRDVLAILYAQKWIVIIFAVAVVTLAVLHGLFSTPMYRSTAVVEVVPKTSHELKSQSLGAAQPAGNLYMNQQFYRTETDKILSLSTRKTVVKRFREELGYDDFADNGAAQLSGILSVVPRSNSRLIDISIVHSDPQKAAVLANLTAQVYLDLNIGFRQKAAKSAKEWLSGQLDEYKERINKSSQRLLAFRSANDLGDVEEAKTTLASQFTELNTSFASIEAKRVQLETDVIVHERLMKSGQYDELANVVTSELVDNLAQAHSLAQTEHDKVSEEYGPKHSVFQKSESTLRGLEQQLQRELERYLRGQKAQLSKLAAKEKSLSSKIEGKKTDLLAKQHLLAEHKDLMGQVNHNRKFHDKLVQRLDELTLASRTQLNNATIIDNAVVATNPYAPKLLFNGFVGLFVGLAGGVLLGFLKEYVDDTVGSPTDVALFLDLPYLGLIPEVRGEMSRNERTLFTISNSDSAVAEAIRSIRAMLELNQGSGSFRKLMVSSAAASEGKTATVVRLGVAYAQVGKRVLLIDADLRRPQIHKVFDLDRQVGLTTALLGQTTVDEAIQSTAIDGLDVMVAGPQVVQPNELLSSTKMKELTEWLSQQYDLVILDTPPIGAVSDALVLSQVVDGVALVVRAKAHSRVLIQHTVDRLKQVNANILGLVLNAVRIEGSRYYSYRYGYGPEGYSSTPTERSAAK